MALCTLLKLHREREGWPESIFAYTIDHKVRPESHQEATMVGNWIRTMGNSNPKKASVDIRFPSSGSTIRRELAYHSRKRKSRDRSPGSETKNPFRPCGYGSCG